MTDSRLSSLAMLSIENDCARSLDYDNVITAFANKKFAPDYLNDTVFL